VLVAAISLLLASLACYSGQVSGVFEVTPYLTQTPIPPAENPRFKVLETVLAPREVGRVFFNMTVFPEPLQPSLLNSKALCEANSPAQALYAGIAGDGETHYLIDCAGSVGWAAESRLAGPLLFARDELAITVSDTGQPVRLLDESTFQPVVSFQVCAPEALVSIQNVLAADTNHDGSQEALYLIECPAGTGNRGLVANSDLFGPVKAQVKDRALAINPTGLEGDGPFRLASEPAPITNANVVDGNCPRGSVLEIQSAKLVERVVYYNVACGEIEGWVDQARFTGPLRFDAGAHTVIYVEPRLVFEDELPSDAVGYAQAVDASAEDAEAQPTEVAPDAAQGAAAPPKKVVEYVPPAYLTSSPAPAVREGDNANVVGQCLSGAVATTLEYTGVNDTVYYRATCDECVTWDDAPGDDRACLAYETRQGWIDQRYLRGPVDFAPGDKVMLNPSSAAIMTDEADGRQYARIPATMDGASSIGRFTEFAGRCPLEGEFDVVGVLMEKARTSNKFNFFYQVQCDGQKAANTLETDNEGTSRPVVAYATDESTAITGIVAAKDLVAQAD
jgi:hypothetical protein